ncbi:hypothetical protein HYV79_00245 [Candidatus Woesearchaeota archaeon]|nr:hypothetical protein [Candidatus Woesearchaeota archaeon]
MPFDFLKKKKESELPPPPPPPADISESGGLEFPVMPDIPPIHAEEGESEEFHPSVREHHPLEQLPKVKALRKPTEPIFVSLDDFKKVNDHLNKIRSRVEEANTFIKELEKLHDEEEKIVESWIEYVQEVEKKLTLADEIIESHEKRQ